MATLSAKLQKVQDRYEKGSHHPTTIYLMWAKYLKKNIEGLTPEDTQLVLGMLVKGLKLLDARRDHLDPSAQALLAGELLRVPTS